MSDADSALRRPVRVVISYAHDDPAHQARVLVRELPPEAMIGRRAQLRTTMAVLRRTPEAVRRFGAASGVQLTGVAGIGKTAVAGRVISRLRDDGWLIAVHQGRWNPTALISATARAISDAMPSISGPARDALPVLTDSDRDDVPRLEVIAALLASQRLLVVFDDFEQNLIPGGDAFLDPATEQVIMSLAEAADPGALLLTCRHPLPGPDWLLVQVPVPALSPAELRRLFLRLPAVAGLDAADQRLLTRAIGGHPRLIEFADALLRGDHASLRPVRARLANLARAEGLSLDRDPSPARVFDQAMLLGSADILLDELLKLLTPRQDSILRQAAVCRAPMTLDDLASTLSSDRQTADDTVASPPDPAALRADVERLTDLTLLAARDDVLMHPWTAELVTRNTADLSAQHGNALAMRFRRFEQARGSYDDLIDIPRHLAALRRYDDIADFAAQATRILPGTLAAVAYLAEIRSPIPTTERAWLAVADREVQFLLQSGDLAAARKQLQAMRQQAQTQAAADPADHQWQRDLSIIHTSLGDVAGDLTAARAAYQAGLDIRVRLAAADPANSEWQRDVAASHVRLGDLAVAVGDLAAARAAYQAALDVAVRLAAADPANAQWQRDLELARQRLSGLPDPSR